MANTTETVFIEFVVDDQQLESATDTLQKNGKIDKVAADQFKKTNAELAKRQQVIDNLNKQLRETQAQNAKSIADLESRMQTFIKDFVEGFSEGVIESLKQAGIEYDEFGKVINKNNEETVKSTETLKARLNEITKQLQVMKAAGEDDTESYHALVKEAGNLRDTLGDVSSEINQAAANSQKLNGLLDLGTGITGAFAVAEGALGAFGAQGDELNETLLKVNSALSILQGFQAINNVLQKESAASIFLNTAAQKVYNVVIGESVGLMAAFRVALAATGIGLLILGVIALTKALERQNKELDAANEAIELNKKLNEADRKAIEDVTDQILARAEEQGEAESNLIKIRGHALTLQREGLVESNKLLAAQRDALDNTSEAYFVLNRQIEDNNILIKDIDQKLIVASINLEKQLRSERLQGIADALQAQLDGATKNSKNELDLAKQTARAKAAVDLNEAGQNLEKRLLIEADLQKQIRELDLQYARVRQQDRIAQTERALLSIQKRSRQINERQSQEEIDLQKQKIREEARLELLQEGLTKNQRNLIIENALNDQLQLQKNFNKQTNEEALNDFISRNNAELSILNIDSKERLRLQEENLIAQSQIEINANQGLVDKIKEIRAKLNEDLRALRLASLQKELNDELALTEARTGVLRRASERIAANENKSLNARLNAINQIAALDIAAINKREDALDDRDRKSVV